MRKRERKNETQSYCTMKKILILMILISGLGLTSLIAQDQPMDTIPETYLVNLHGHRINTKDIHNHGKPFIISFWASWQKTSLLELNNIHDAFKLWHKETGVKVFAIAIDYPETYDQVKAYAHHHKWEFDILIDEHSHFEKKFNVRGIPHTMLFDGNRHIVWQRHAYSSGDEEDLHQALLNLSLKNKAANNNQ